MRGLPFSFDFRHAPIPGTVFVAGVFFTFAPVVLISVVPRNELGWGTIALWFALSGLCGALWAVAANVSWRFLIVAGLMQAGLAIAIPLRNAHPFEIAPVAFDRIGVPAIISIALGYACFVWYLRTEGARAFSLWTEMDLASRIHRHLVPPITLELGHASVAGRSEASGAMGGDLVECIEQHDGSIDLLIADVSGHGVRAGVVMAMLKALARHDRGRYGDGDAAREPLPVPEIIASMNRTLCELLEPGMFVTLAYARVSPRGEVDAVVAGHPPIFLLRAQGAIEELPAESMPLGILAEATFPVTHARLAPGDTLILYSDGLVEVHVGPGGREPFLGLDELRTIIAAASAEHPSRLPARVMKDVARRSTDPSQLDDRSILCLRQRLPDRPTT